MAKQQERKPSKKQNSLVSLFTSKNEWAIRKMAFDIELVFYDYYKYINDSVTVLGVKSKVMPAAELIESRDCDLYNDYVKEARKLPEGYYGVQLNFIIDESKRGDEDDL